MKTTSALAGSMRRLLANLHPPSPPTAKESQQLLNVLQKSFKARLDEKHPAPSQHEFWPKSHEHDSIPIIPSSTSSHATNSHLSSILTSPVIGALEGLSTTEDAISRFEKLVAEPEIDLSRLAGLLLWYSRENKRDRQRHHAESFSDRLNSWLHITNRQSREAFLLNQSTRKAAFDLLISERKEAILWTWLRLVYERQLVEADLSAIEWLEVEDHLVSHIMRMSIQKNDNNDAAQQFLEACRYRLESGRVAPTENIHTTSLTQSSPPLTIAGKRLASAIIFHRHQHGIDPGLFEDVLKHLPSAFVSSDLNSAFCAVYHPKRPTAKDVYGIIKNAHLSTALTKSLQEGKPRPRKVVMISLLDAAKLALDEGKNQQASSILDFAVERFPEYLPARRTEEPEPEIERYLDLIPG